MWLILQNVGLIAFVPYAYVIPEGNVYGRTLSHSELFRNNETGAAYDKWWSYVP